MMDTPLRMNTTEYSYPAQQTTYDENLPKPINELGIEAPTTIAILSQDKVFKRKQKP
jgi:hypothetical protein